VGKGIEHKKTMNEEYTLLFDIGCIVAKFCAFLYIWAAKLEKKKQLKKSEELRQQRPPSLYL
jgi:hypothetical protein